MKVTKEEVFEELKKLLLLALNTGVKALVENLIKLLFNL